MKMNAEKSKVRLSDTDDVGCISVIDTNSVLSGVAFGIREGISKLIDSVLQRRARYGGKNWRPEKKATSTK